MAKNSNEKVDTFEKTLFKAADKLRKNMDAAEYKHIVLGLVFLKYISDSFEELYTKIKKAKGEYIGANPEDVDEYRAENVFFVPQVARWSHLHSRAMLPTIGKDIDDAMEAIEKENLTLKGILPKVYSRPNLDKASLGSLINLIGNIALGDEVSKSKDILGRVYEYFLGEFALAEGKKGGQFYTPKSIVQLLVNMIEPFKGRIYDPCCGSGGMFVMSEKFIQEHVGRLDDIAIYGQESNQTTYRLARMNLAIRGIDGGQVKWNTEGSFLKDLHPDLKADYILANPPFNDSDWSGELLKKDGRWKYGMPPASNANFAWIQHILYHLKPQGIAGLVLSNGSLSVNNLLEGEIKKNLIERGVVECIVSLPDKLFYSTQIPACLWFIKKNVDDIVHDDQQVLFIDARNVGALTEKKYREFSNEDIELISSTYHSWKKNKELYKDEKGFCKSVKIKEILKKDVSLIPGNYVGVPLESFDKNTSDKTINDFKETFFDLVKKEEHLNSEISKQLKLIPQILTSKRKTYKLGDFFKITGGTPFKGSDFKNNGIPVLKIKNIKAYRLNLETLDYITEETASLYPNAKLIKNDLLISMTGNRYEGGKDSWVGKVALFTEDKTYYLNQRIGILRFHRNDIADLNYISYYLSSDYMQECFIKKARGSGGQANLSPSQILEIEVILPSLSDQKLFSNVIRALDTKNTFNRVTNEKLFECGLSVFQKSITINNYES